MRSLHRLSVALRLRRREIITLVGAGGKTTTMYTLAKELANEGKKIVTTTTTKLWLPTKEDTEHLIIDPSANIPSDIFSRYRHVTCVTRLLVKEGKVGGVKPDTIERWLSDLDMDYVIIEGDGSKGRPFKAPANYEPVIPPSTTLYVPMVGVDTLGVKLDSENVHRPHIVARLAKVDLGDKVTPHVVAAIIKHYLKMPPASSRSTVFINKVSTQHQVEQALLLTKELRSEDVVFGSVLKKKYWRV